MSILGQAAKMGGVPDAPRVRMATTIIIKAAGKLVAETVKIPVITI